MIDSRTVPDAALLLRIPLGIMFLAHGLTKLLVFTPAGTAKSFQSIGFSVWMAYPVIAFEVLGGLMLILGVAPLGRCGRRHRPLHKSEQLGRSRDAHQNRFHGGGHYSSLSERADGTAQSLFFNGKCPPSLAGGHFFTLARWQTGCAVRRLHQLCVTRS